ncbi:MAG: hypothetical protein ABSG67_08595 [Thermoguttaceae bacterium]
MPKIGNARKTEGQQRGRCRVFLRKHQWIKRQIERTGEILVLLLKYPKLFERWLALLSLVSSPVRRAIDGQAVQNKPSKKSYWHSAWV